MKTVECISCKQEIPLTGPFVEFECPECDWKGTEDMVDIDEDEED